MLAPQMLGGCRSCFLHIFITTFCQGCVALIGADYINIVDIDGSTILGTAATMGVLSLLTSIAGLPELKEETPTI